MAERESDPGFTFVDRRRRAPDEEPVRPAPAAPSPGRPPMPAPAPPAPAPSGVAAPGRGDREGGEGPPRADLPSLCVMLYSDALVSLGQVPDPVTGQPHRDLDQARFAIDLLGMLQEKTAGNRTPEESAVLDEALANLRMAFVGATRGR